MLKGKLGWDHALRFAIFLYTLANLVSFAYDGVVSGTLIGNLRGRESSNCCWGSGLEFKGSFRGRGGNKLDCMAWKISCVNVFVKKMKNESEKKAND